VGHHPSEGALAEGRVVRIVDTGHTASLKLTQIRRKDAKTVSIISLGCFHPVVKVQSASIHFFLGSDDEKEEADEEEDEEVDVKALHHRREINKKTRSGDKKLQKKLNRAKKVRSTITK
jgi:16S rRNA A1518/A1519 N6-dimethyltransferase RsmA/KsgA/DIM1 with predicted DNA glycosylase/AP lyase activity